MKPSPKIAQILMVEDNFGDIALMKEAFKESHLYLDLHVATDGEDALEYLQRQGKHVEAPRPDFILLDLNLQRMDGRVFLRRIRSHPEFKEIPVIIFTGSRLATDMREMEEMGISGYLAKPVDMLGFLDVARRLRDFWFRSSVFPPPEL